jgi:hypothetical protein
MSLDLIENYSCTYASTMLMCLLFFVFDKLLSHMMWDVTANLLMVTCEFRFTSKHFPVALVTCSVLKHNELHQVVTSNTK